MEDQRLIIPGFDNDFPREKNYSRPYIFTRKKIVEVALCNH